MVVHGMRSHKSGLLSCVTGHNTPPSLFAHRSSRTNRHFSVCPQPMPSTHPLDLTEILLLVIAYLPLKRLPACARVSKTWYQACIPVIWENISFYKDPKPNLIQSHSHLVKKVKAGRMSEEYSTLRLSNLDSFELGCTGGLSYNLPRTVQFIMEHPTITRLSLEYIYQECPPEFWDALLGFPHLRILFISSRNIFGTNPPDKFWQLCTRLERLEIVVSYQSSLNMKIPPGEFPSIKHLGVEGCNLRNVPLFINFIRRCPRLTSIRWRSIFDDGTFLSSLAELLETKALPDMEHLVAGAKKVTNGTLTKVIQGMSRINTFLISVPEDAFKLDFATLFQPHFSSLRVLKMSSGKGVKSRLAQDVMSSCPLLEKLDVPSVDAIVIAEGKPWVCLRLKSLDMGIYFDPPSTLSHLQPLVFDKLSKLTRLERWYCPRPVTPGINQKNGTGIDLRIENGLNKLSTLWLIRDVSIHYTDQEMGDAEVDWILQHWKHLVKIGMVLNKRDNAVGKALRVRMTERGISVPYQ
ncbi:MAG: hypothetical protein J3Q66DRAFT_385679 [Benniella sp.]|nr:MAG: hypothetical protein J3Q66DRAFT_385679 [Benniella sp.]